jgi:acyl-CoA thioester hydrolase
MEAVEVMGEPNFFVGFEGVVEPKWIDINGHMNVRWYDYVFDTAEHNIIDTIGLTNDYIAANGRTTYRLEKRIRYEKELLQGEQLQVRSRLVFTDERIFKHRHELLNLTRNVRAASAEFVSIHVDLSVRKSARIIDPVILENLRRLARAHAVAQEASF